MNKPTYEELEQQVKELVAQVEQLRVAALLAIEYIDAIPSDLQLPTMPGFDRDWFDETLSCNNKGCTVIKIQNSGYSGEHTIKTQSREDIMVTLMRDENGKPTVWCDPEIADLVLLLNIGGIRTIASCSGHGHRPGNIVLADGRELIIARNFEEARKIDRMFPGINGEPSQAPTGVTQCMTQKQLATSSCLVFTHRDL